ncbi:hypothetical protein KFL_001440060 [Klebsormidium nitens]|uniref:Uncharacterized protein n=1 Tax=Klebsormidium nitens TaxID=105231 RepID=A0A1Y1I5C2_KLENI|nr:hypothetical protein KFL_001440060 [Klebsormidium nitens]|eukprot:GAQ83318.1 hypothetical protein KFL_001440060 [Klebsormidium nitens]
MEGSSNAKKTPSKVLVEELGKRTGVTRLVMKEPNFLSRGTKFSLLEALSSVSWVGCTITGHSSLRVLEYYLPPFNHPIAWHGSFGQRVLSASKGTLKELIIVSYDVHGPRLLQLAKSFPNVNLLKVDGYIYGRGSFADFGQVGTLDVSNLGSDRESLARRRVPVVYAPPQSAWPPKSDCPLLRRIQVRATAGVPISALGAKKIRNRFAEDVERIFAACPQLKELVFSGCSGKELVKWEKRFEEVEVVA